MIYVAVRPDRPPKYRAVGCFCFHDGRVLLLRRALGKRYEKKWGLPGGRVKDGEETDVAMARELAEETGIRPAASGLKRLHAYHVILENNNYKYDVFRLDLADPPSVKLNLTEHTAYRWRGTKDALRLPLFPDLGELIRREFPAGVYLPLQPDAYLGEAPPDLTPIAELERSVTDTMQSTLRLLHPLGEKNWYVSIGANGVGKTAALKAMRKARQGLKYVTEHCILNPPSRLNFYLREAHGMRLEYFFKFQMEALAVRFRQAMSAPPNSLVDETIYSTLAYSRVLYRLGWIEDHDYQTFFSNYLTHEKILQRPARVFHFYCKPEVILSRMKERGRDIERDYPRRYIVTQCEEFARVAKELKEKMTVIPINTERLDASEIARRYAPEVWQMAAN